MLTPDDVIHFKHRLEEQRATLFEQITSLENSLSAPDQYSDTTEERGDDASLLQNHDDAWDQLNVARVELTQVEKALSRIDAGIYGTSEISGKPIPRERLEALPTATSLVDETPGT